MKNKILPIISIFLFLGLLGVSFFSHKLNEENKNLKDEIILKEADFLEKVRINGLQLTEKEEAISLLQKDLEEEKESYDDLEDEFENLEDQISSIGRSVGTLEKLQFTDPELLAKYSKVFFLNEHYAPEKISSVDKEHLLNENSGITISSQVLPFLEDLMEEAEDDDVDLKIISGYRSFDKQKSIKQNYVNLYGQEAADTFSADQGESEHQLGTAVDFTTSSLGAFLNGFAAVEEYEWLQDNAHRFGFTLSYPEDNEFYQFEPWHWRFVGKDLARDLHRNEEFLYDVPQRELDEYLVDIFDN